MAAATSMSLSSSLVSSGPALGSDGLSKLSLVPSRAAAGTSSRRNVVMSAKKTESSSASDQQQQNGAVAVATALALMASTAVLPETAEAAITPSLKNLLLSVAAGFGVLTAIVVAVLGVATFDPVKRKE